MIIGYSFHDLFPFLRWALRVSSLLLPRIDRLSSFVDAKRGLSFARATTEFALPSLSEHNFHARDRRIRKERKIRRKGYVFPSKKIFPSSELFSPDKLMEISANDFPNLKLLENLHQIRIIEKNLSFEYNTN